MDHYQSIFILWSTFNGHSPFTLSPFMAHEIFLYSSIFSFFAFDLYRLFSSFSAIFTTCVGKWGQKDAKIMYEEHQNFLECFSIFRCVPFYITFIQKSNLYLVSQWIKHSESNERINKKIGCRKQFPNEMFAPVLWIFSIVANHAIKLARMCSSVYVRNKLCKRTFVNESKCMLSNFKCVKM